MLFCVFLILFGKILLNKVYNCVLCEKSNTLFCYCKIDRYFFSRLDEFCNFYDAAGSVLDSKYYIHPWLRVIWSSHIPNGTFSNSTLWIGIGNRSVVDFAIHSRSLTNIVSKTSLYLWLSPNMGLNWFCLLCVPCFDCLLTRLIW